MSSARSSRNRAASTVIDHIGSGGHNQVRGKIINKAGVNRHDVVVGDAESDRANLRTGTGSTRGLDGLRTETLGDRGRLQDDDSGIRCPAAATRQASRSCISKGRRGGASDLKE